MSYNADQLRAMTGSPAGTSRWFEITQQTIDAFAGITEDRQFIHIDPQRAAETPFGGTIAHGFLTLAMLSAMAYDAQPQVAGARLSVNYGFNRLRFLAPVPAGGRIRGHFTLRAVEETVVGEITLTWGVEVEIEGQAKPALAAEWINRHYTGQS
ncbi:MAG: MaoC family dehydratase [Rhodobacteraceae bacterium]|nr:MaoC family dehydratase [Paracoccaceae bacterium]